MGMGATLPLPWTIATGCPGQRITQDLPVAFGLFNQYYVEFLDPLEGSGVTMPALALRLDDAWGIIGDGSQEDYAGSRITFNWSSSPAVSPPDPEAAR